MNYNIVNSRIQKRFGEGGGGVICARAGGQSGIVFARRRRMACASAFWKRAALLEFLLYFFSFLVVPFALLRPRQSKPQLPEMLSPTSIVLMGCCLHLYCRLRGHKPKDHLPSGPLSVEGPGIMSGKGFVGTRGQ